MSQDKNERIFISYKREDRERVFALKDSIEQATGEKCWIDLDGIESNAQFVAKIVRAIDECEVFLFMRSKEHNNITNLETDWTIREVNYALEEHKNIVIVSLDNAPMPKWFKFMFPNKQEIDATNPDKLARLNVDLCEWLGICSSTISKSTVVEQPTNVVPSQPTTIVQTPADIEQAKRDALPKGEFQVGDLMYKASKNGNGVEVVGHVDYVPIEIHIPAQIVYGRNTYNVECIGFKAFSFCTLLKSIIIPNSVRRIDAYAFQYCNSLTSITIPQGLTSIEYAAFRECSNLTSIILPDSVTYLSSAVFLDCSNLKSIIISNNVKIIEAETFRGCSALTEVVLGNNVLRIRDRAFQDCSNIKRIIIPQGVTSIGEFAFSDCKKMANITIPDSVTSMSMGAFYRCSCLSLVCIGNSLSCIDSYTFGMCESLISITISNSVTKIKKHAFYGCTSLKTVRIPNAADVEFLAFPIFTKKIRE